MSIVLRKDADTKEQISWTGMQATGTILCQIFKNTGFHIFASLDYMSRIRGGNNFFQLRVSDRPRHTLR
ncbi:MAG: 2-oxoacid:acceptor oxidoreductase family protein [Candidatus Brocadia sp.]|nr:2-oxoacid:acceptor oxidoreductase family protein [Candidatus Brocadia sp.]UJS19531.1 MAG: 2-oxoacid:acceptor oxidoreductase family protein [Candidatus Brocadia sp.]